MIRGVFKNVGLALRLLREMRGLKLAQLARMASVGKSQLSRYEAGQLPMLEPLSRILTALEVQPYALFSLAAFLDELPSLLTSPAPWPVLALGTPKTSSLFPVDAFPPLFDHLLDLFRQAVRRQLSLET